MPVTAMPARGAAAGGRARRVTAAAIMTVAAPFAGCANGRSGNSQRGQSTSTHQTRVGFA